MSKERKTSGTGLSSFFSILPVWQGKNGGSELGTLQGALCFSPTWNNSVSTEEIDHCDHFIQMHKWLPNYNQVY